MAPRSRWALPAVGQLWPSEDNDDGEDDDNDDEDDNEDGDDNDDMSSSQP